MSLITPATNVNFFSTVLGSSYLVFWLWGKELARHSLGSIFASPSKFLDDSMHCITEYQFLSIRLVVGNHTFSIQVILIKSFKRGFIFSYILQYLASLTLTLFHPWKAATRPRNGWRISRRMTSQYYKVPVLFQPIWSLHLQCHIFPFAGCWFLELASLTTAQLMEKVRGLQNLAYQLGLDEGTSPKRHTVVFSAVLLLPVP